MRILVVEDNRDLAETMIERLQGEGHVADLEVDGDAASILLSHAEFDLVILDVNLPGRSGLDILREMRARQTSTPVLLLTARSQIEDRVLGLDAGADDFMVKPFDFRELTARVRMLGRRFAGSATNEVSYGNLVFDRNSKRALVDGRDIDLKTKEVQLLEILLSNIGTLLSKEDVADRLYSYEEAPSLNAVEQHMTRLRRKLEGTLVQVKTVRGLGYLVYVDDA
ncbi:response regulator transcription factor [Ruegeria profundi]|uniref:response regulator transcription factor n=1 Tax=Ruegeria profundi TaxID=1685378 RepID=UPI001CD30239|nr:response regulator transcription factor [Ruegeria profundi]MCA0930678.1 response regulator transcription factor [Ruegeria profundi]